MGRMLLASCALLTAGCLGAGSGQADNRPNTSAPAPSRLDYLLLASLADTPRPLAMSAYRPEPLRDAE
jgi:hypothetical protein